MTVAIGPPSGSGQGNVSGSFQISTPTTVFRLRRKWMRHHVRVASHSITRFSTRTSRNDTSRDGNYASGARQINNELKGTSIPFGYLISAP